MNNCYVYIIQCKDNTFYTGVTNNYIRRWKQHRTGKGGARYVKYHGFLRPVFLKQVENKSIAMKKEKQIKKLTHKEKLNLINSNNNMLNNYIKM